MFREYKKWPIYLIIVNNECKCMYYIVKNHTVIYTHTCCLTAGAWQCRPAMWASQTGETSPVYSWTGQGPGGCAEGGEGRSHAGSASLPAGSGAHQRCDEGSQCFPPSPRRTDRYRHSFSSGTEKLSAETSLFPCACFIPIQTSSSGKKMTTN